MKPQRQIYRFKPRKAVAAGLVGLVIVFPIAHYYFSTEWGYRIWDLSAMASKNWRTFIGFLGFVVPYVLVKWIVERR